MAERFKQRIQNTTENYSKSKYSTYCCTWSSFFSNLLLFGEGGLHCFLEVCELLWYQDFKLSFLISVNIHNSRETQLLRGKGVTKSYQIYIIDNFGERRINSFTAKSVLETVWGQVEAQNLL